MVLTMAPGDGVTSRQCDILVEGNRITAMGSGLQADAGTTVIDGRNKLVTPGLINAHTHSSETFLKGRYEKMPLETWLLYAYPFFIGDNVPPRLIYLRCMLLAMESLRNGVTTLCDDFFDPPRHDPERLAQVFAAYGDSGIRANVGCAAMNVPTMDALPYAREVMSQALQEKLDFGPPMTAKAYTEFCSSAIESFHEPDGRLRFMLVPSAPQRCTIDLLQSCNELAQKHDIPLHSHVLETVVQYATGPELYGKSLIEFMHDIGILNRNTTLAHSVWVDDHDTELMGASGCSVVHNAMSNLKLGSGVSPVRKILDAGVTIGLGTDGVSSNDTARIFDVMRTAALLHNTDDPDPEKWLSAEIIMKAATLDGARTAMLEKETGSLEVGKVADLVMFDLSTYPFTPLNDIARHLVYAENGSSIELVMVDGKIVVQDNEIKTINEDEILREIREEMPAYLSQHTEFEKLSEIFRPAMEQIHQRASDRYSRWQCQRKNA